MNHCRSVIGELLSFLGNLAWQAAVLVYCQIYGFLKSPRKFFRKGPIDGRKGD